MANLSTCSFPTRKKLFPLYQHSSSLVYYFILFLGALMLVRGDDPVDPPSDPPDPPSVPPNVVPPENPKPNSTKHNSPSTPVKSPIVPPLNVDDRNKTVSYGFNSNPPNDTNANVTKPRRVVLVYSAESIERMVQNYQARSSTHDPLHEDYYTRHRLGDNVWFNIERVVPFKTFVGWMANTTRITDRFDPSQDKSLIADYIQKPEVPCAPQSVFQLSEDVIMTDDVNRRMQLESKMSDWFSKNSNTPPEQMCNRFRGLQCSPTRKVCECENGRTHFVSYARTTLDDSKGMYHASCYVKSWKSCSHLSLDTNIASEYKAFHAHPNNMKQFLMRLATPMPKMARCERGSYCVDLVLNKKKPICWCQSRQYSKICFNSTVPMLDRFLSIRKSFHQMMIMEKDRDTKCTVDDILESNLRTIQTLSEEPERHYYQIMITMKTVLLSRSKGTRFCDFRKGLACGPYKRTCTYKAGCGPGRVLETLHNGHKVCRVNNGYPCPTLELQCIRGAVCKDFGQGKHCHCEPGRFGDLCRFQAPTFFGTLLQSRVSGFVGYHFMNMQEVVNLVLLPLERLMTLGYGKPCNPNLDGYALTIIKYLGNVRSVVLDKMDVALGSVQRLVGKNEPLCDYKRFLGCAQFSGKCEPMIPDVALYESQVGTDRFTRGTSGKVTTEGKVILTLRDKAMCMGPGNYTNVPAIYQDIIHVQCMPHHVCRALDGQSEAQQYHTSDVRYCLCPVGQQGVGCDKPKMAGRMTRIDVYQLPAPVMVASGKSAKGRKISIVKM